MLSPVDIDALKMFKETTNSPEEAVSNFLSFEQALLDNPAYMSAVLGHLNRKNITLGVSKIVSKMRTNPEHRDDFYMLSKLTKLLKSK